MSEGNGRGKSDARVLSLENVLFCYHCDRFTAVADFGASFAISGLLAASSKTLLAPFERIKLILQTQASSAQIARTSERPYDGFLDALVRIPREQGVLSLWRGNFINICRYFPAQAINFAFYDVYYRALMRTLEPRTSRGRDVLSFLSGGLVGVTSCTILYPLTFCTTRIAVDVGGAGRTKREFTSLNDCLSKVYRTDGYRGFYQGLSCSATGMFLYRSTYFGVYTAGKRAYLNDYAFDPTSHAAFAPLLVSLALAQIASTISTVISYPLDTIARRKMLRSGRGPESYASTREVIGKIVEKEGPVGFYRGVLANVLASVAGSFVLVGYDVIKGFYERSEGTKVNRESPDASRK